MTAKKPAKRHNKRSNVAKAATKSPRVHIRRPLPGPDYFASLAATPEGLAFCDMIPDDAQPLNLTRVPASFQTSRFLAWIAWYHAAYAERATSAAAQLANRITDHNRDVAAIASHLDLGARDRLGTGILQFDWAEMVKRIEQAAAKHKNNTRGRAKNANRHLAYHCPTCSERREKPDGTVQWTNTIRASASDRIIMCAGRHGAQHAPTLCEFDQASQPDYRLADDAAGTAIAPEATSLDTYSETALANGQHSRSAARIAAEKRRYAAKLASDDLADMLTPAPASDPTAEFGF